MLLGWGRVLGLHLPERVGAGVHGGRTQVADRGHRAARGVGVQQVAAGSFELVTFVVGEGLGPGLDPVARLVVGVQLRRGGVVPPGQPVGQVVGVGVAVRPGEPGRCLRRLVAVRVPPVGDLRDRRPARRFQLVGGDPVQGVIRQRADVPVRPVGDLVDLGQVVVGERRRHRGGRVRHRRQPPGRVVGVGRGAGSISPGRHPPIRGVGERRRPRTSGRGQEQTPVVVGQGLGTARCTERGDPPGRVVAERPRRGRHLSPGAGLPGHPAHRVVAVGDAHPTRLGPGRQPPGQVVRAGERPVG